MNTIPSRVEVFRAGPFCAVELGPADVPQLQRFFDDNPEYFLTITGEPPTPREADEEINDALPDGWPHTKKWALGFIDERATAIGTASVVSDLLAPGVWHIGLFMIATRLRGTGVAALLCDGLDAWMHAEGARWLRLGVVRGNARAERFWERRGYVDLREREVPMGARTNTVRVMLKPPAGGAIEAYLAQVPRDRPDAA
jgi:GNAT superfamily N-acetyltransferase